MNVQNLKINIFPGVNDVIKTATVTEAGNGGDLTYRFNTLIDYVNDLSVITETWEDITFYLDTSSQISDGDGLTENTPATNANQLTALISKKIVNKNLTIKIKGSLEDSLDFKNIKFVDTANLVIEKFNEDTSKWTFNTTIINDCSLLKNYSGIKSVTIKDAFFLASNSLIFNNYNKLHLEKCEFQIDKNDSYTLAIIDNINTCKIQDCRFNGHAQELTIANAIKIKSTRFLELNNNSFYRFMSIVISTENSTIFIASDQIFDESSESTNVIESINSLFYFTNKFSISPSKILNVNSLFKNISHENEASKTLFFHFPNLTDENIVLIPNCQTDITIKKLIVSDKENTANYDVLVNGFSLSKEQDTTHEKIYDLNDSNNRANRDDKDTIELKITGSGTKTTIQLEYYELSQSITSSNNF